MSDGDRLDLLIVAHAGALQVVAEDTVDETDCRKVLHAAEPDLPQLLQENMLQTERIGPADPGQHRRVLHDRQDLGRHFDDDAVGVAVRHHAGERTATRHAETARVVDDDQIGAARLGKLGRDAGAGAAADDRPTGCMLGLKPRQNLSPGDRHIEGSFRLSLTMWANRGGTGADPTARCAASPAAASPLGRQIQGR